MGLGLVLMTDLESGVLEFGHRQSRWLSKERSWGEAKRMVVKRRGLARIDFERAGKKGNVLGRGSEAGLRSSHGSIVWKLAVVNTFLS